MKKILTLFLVLVLSFSVVLSFSACDQINDILAALDKGSDGLGDSENNDDTTNGSDDNNAQNPDDENKDDEGNSENVPTTPDDENKDDEGSENKPTDPDDEDKDDDGGSGEVIIKPDPESLEFTLSDDGTYYSVSGIGNCTDTNIVIPETYNSLPVTAIGENAFTSNPDITGITIPDSITYIADWAFNGCDKLNYNEYDNAYYLGNDNNPYLVLIKAKSTDITSCEINPDTKILYFKAFVSCFDLTSLVVPEGVTMLGASLLDCCIGITSITIPASVTYIGNLSFQNCENLRSVYITDLEKWCDIRFETITANPLNNSTDLYLNQKLVTDLVIPEEITRVGEYAFYGCSSFSSITIPKGTTQICKGAFSECRNLTSINVDNDNANYKSIDGNLYSKNGNTLIQYSIGKSDTSFIVPEVVTNIGDYAFCWAFNLTNITLKDNITHIGNEAFSACRNLESINIPEGTSHIGENAFSFCYQLSSIIIPKNITRLSFGLFFACTNLTNIVIPASVTTIEEWALVNNDELANVYYTGTVEDWDKILISGDNPALTDATRYYYSENEPTVDGDFWHYVDGIPTKWGEDEEPENNVYVYDGSAVTITFYHTMNSRLRQVLDKYIAEFNTLYPNITVEHFYVGGYDDLKNQINLEIANGYSPNLAYCYYDHVALYNVADAVLPLNSLIASTATVERADGTTEVFGLTEEQLNDFIPSFYAEGSVFDDAGTMYTLPLSKSTEILYYNRDVFEKHNLTVPTTWDEMEEVCKTLKELYPDCIPLGYDNASNWFITMCEQFGSDYTSLDPQNHYTFDNETNRAFAKRIREWYEKGYVITQDLAGTYLSEPFCEEMIFMNIGSSAGASYYRPNADNGHAFNVGIAHIPQIDLENPASIYQGPSLCIFNDTDKNKVAATWLFVKFITTNTYFQAEFSMVSGYMPVIKSALENEIYEHWLNTANEAKDTDLCNNYLQPLAVQVAFEQADGFFIPPVFDTCNYARNIVGDLLGYIMVAQIPDGSTVDALIKQAFEDAVEECKLKD